MLNRRKQFTALIALILTAALSLPAAAASPAPTSSPGPSLRPENRQTLNRECVDWCYYQGLMDSYNSASIFKPYDPATRAVVAEALCQLDAGPEKRPTGLFSGVECGQTVASGAPEQAVTRQELARMLYRWAGEPEDWRDALGENPWPPPPVEEMDDWEDIAPQARAAVDWAVGTMVMPHYYFGDEEQYFLPQGDVTKNDLAVVLYRLYLLACPPCTLRPEEVSAILLHSPEEERRLEDPEEIRRFLELLQGFRAESALLMESDLIGCAGGRGFVILPKAEEVWIAEQNALRLEIAGPGALRFTSRAIGDFSRVMYFAPVPSPFPKDELAQWIYGPPDAGN